MALAMVTALVFITVIYTIPDCQPVRRHNASINSSKNDSSVNDSAFSILQLKLDHSVVDSTLLSSDHVLIDLNMTLQAINSRRIKRASKKHVPSDFSLTAFDNFLMNTHNESNYSGPSIYGYNGHGFVIQVIIL